MGAGRPWRMRMLEDIQLQVLLDVLSDNRQTDYGCRYDFAGITDAGQFRKALPLSSYDDYQPLVQLMARLGEKNIFAADRIIAYNLSFGPDGSSRLIPCTAKFARLFSADIARLLSTGHVLSLCTSLPKKRRFKDGSYLNTITGTLLTECAEQGHIKRNGGKNPFTSPAEVLYPEGMFDQRYVRALFALCDENLRVILAPYIGIVLSFFTLLQEHWETLVEDIAAGIVGSQGFLPGEFQMPESLRARLIRRLKPNPARARRLAMIFSEGFDTPIAKRIWPNLSLVVAENSGLTQADGKTFDEERLKYFIGDVPRNNGRYFTAEALIGRSVRNNSDERALLPKAGFFEFIDQDDDDPTRALTVGEIKADRRYEIVVTNCQGLYRYRLGDIIRVLRVEDGAPIFNIEYRSNAAIPFHHDDEVHSHLNLFSTMERAVDADVSAHVT